ncbi:c(7)-type cytochrome triheme domain-containing protein [uncultured Piscinibacter sp.]|uniref:c(7)-type cytochrome triheme domain-containing protein n=1 Tax=uncultured Piscinibacter sp. TaxID=1131835 RepID=UPI00262705E4|nr:c(7)-type cytochrome triheme domain-containing protein [uncultured Piscinibacter sp.]
MKRILLAALAAGALFLSAVDSFAQTGGKAIYESACIGCHGSGVLGAPKLGEAAAWGPRAKAAGGIDGLVKSATAGTAKGMPPKGGRAELSAAQLKETIEYMMSGGKTATVAAAKPAEKAADKPAAKVSEKEKAAPAVAKPAPAPAPAAAAAPAPAPAPAAAAAPASTAATAARPADAAPAATLAAARAAAPNPPATAEVNAFNRLLRPVGRFNRPAAESGIHDPTNDMTLQLQPPSVAFAAMPKSMAGNHVDWVKSLDSKAIAPRWDRNDPSAAAVVMDLNIVREVKGSMPDVVYPHKQHTEWLDCSNCHPAIFVPQKGANQISMASILLGQKCGVCHGKVAFPVSECRLCHSKKKTEAVVAGERKP